MNSKITPEFIGYYKSLVDDGLSQRSIARELEVAESSLRGWIKKGWMELDGKPLVGGTITRSKHTRKIYDKPLFIGLCAQNNSLVHKRFLKALKVYAEYRGMSDDVIHASPVTYGSNKYQNDKGVWYDPEIQPYLSNESMLVAEGLVWGGELNVSPTSANPLSGKDIYFGENSGIIPHNKVELKSLPTSKYVDCRFQYTTGSITKANYLPKDAGQKAEPHHMYGALMVEVDEDGVWYARQLIAETRTGNFYDLGNYYTAEGVQENVRVEGINHGDIHSEKPDTIVMEATFGEGGMVDELQPKYQFFSDLLDFCKRNHHNINTPEFRYMQQLKHNGLDLVEDDIKMAAEVLEKAQRPYCKNIVVKSNHDEALPKWVATSEPKEDNVWNALFYYKCQTLTLEAMIRDDKDFDILEYWINTLNPKVNATFLKADESFRICKSNNGGIECGNHGHLGINGTRGTPNSFAKLECRQNTGHTHTAGIKGGCFTAGIKGNKDQGYNKGPDTWSLSDIITYQNSKRTIVTWKNGKYRSKLFLG